MIITFRTLLCITIASFPACLNAAQQRELKAQAEQTHVDANPEQEQIKIMSIELEELKETVKRLAKENASLINVATWQAGEISGLKANHDCLAIMLTQLLNQNPHDKSNARLVTVQSHQQNNMPTMQSVSLREAKPLHYAQHIPTATPHGYATAQALAPAHAYPYFANQPDAIPFEKQIEMHRERGRQNIQTGNYCNLTPSQLPTTQKIGQFSESGRPNNSHLLQPKPEQKQ